jgi:hypothetical protein
MHLIHKLVGTVNLPKVCIFMSIKDSEHGCAMLKFLKSPVVSPKPKSKDRI